MPDSDGDTNQREQTPPSMRPWLSTHLRNLLLLSITGMVLYLAYRGEEQARQALYSAFTLLAGMLFGERAALATPVKP